MEAKRRLAKGPKDELEQEVEALMNNAESRISSLLDAPLKIDKPLSEENVEVQLAVRARQLEIESLKSERLKKWQELEDKIQKLDPTFAKQPTSVGSPKDIHDNKSIASFTTVGSGSPRRKRRTKQTESTLFPTSKPSISNDELEELFRKGREELAGLWHSSKFKNALKNVKVVVQQERKEREEEKKKDEREKYLEREREVASEYSNSLDIIRDEMLHRMKRRIEKARLSIAESNLNRSFNDDDEERIEMATEDKFPLDEERNVLLNPQQEARMRLERQNSLLQESLLALMTRREKLLSEILNSSRENAAVPSGKGIKQQSAQKTAVLKDDPTIKVGSALSASPSPRHGLQNVADSPKGSKVGFAVKAARIAASEAAQEARARANSSYRSAGMGSPSVRQNAWGSGRRSSLEDITSPHSRPLPHFPLEKQPSKRVIRPSDKSESPGNSDSLRRSRSVTTVNGLQVGRSRSSTSIGRSLSVERSRSSTAIGSPMKESPVGRLLWAQKQAKAVNGAEEGSFTGSSVHNGGKVSFSRARSVPKNGDRRESLKGVVRASLQEASPKRNETGSSSEQENAIMKREQARQELERERDYEELLEAQYMKRYEERQQMYRTINTKVEQKKKAVQSCRRSAALSSAPFHIKDLEKLSVKSHF